MDIGSPVGLSVLEEGNSCHDSNNGCVVESLSTNDIGNDLTDFLHIEDGHELASNSILPQYSHNMEKEDECEEPCLPRSKIVTSENCSSKCANFRCSSQKEPFAACVDGEHKEQEDEKEEDDLNAAVIQNGYESVNQSPPQHASLPSPLNLVSAMKGSREKKGMPPKKLTVTWAPEVYDPPPSASTFVRIKKPRPRSGSKRNYDFKNGKKKLKGPCKGSSSGGKDKKQARRHGGSSNKVCYQSLDDNDDDDNDEPSAALGDFGVSSSDSFCGSRLLQKSSTKLHLSIAEAT